MSPQLNVLLKWSVLSAMTITMGSPRQSGDNEHSNRFRQSSSHQNVEVSSQELYDDTGLSRVLNDLSKSYLKDLKELPKLSSEWQDSYV